MAILLRRWRAPLVGGVAIWLLSFPLLTWHPTASIHPVYAQGVAIAQADAADHRLVRQLERDRGVAQAALQAAQAAQAARVAAQAAQALAANQAAAAAAPVAAAAQPPAPRRVAPPPAVRPNP